MAGVATGEWPLVGRQPELQLAHRALQRTGGIILAGVAGVGKTRLVREVLQSCKTKGLGTMWVVGTNSSARIPFGAFANYLPIFRTQRDAPARDSMDVLVGAQRAIAERAADRRLVLGVDDAHLLDEASALLTLQLASSNEGISIALTVRDGERPPDAIATLWEEGIAERVDLRPLSRSQIREILEVVLEGRVDGLLVQEAWEVSAGNLLYLRELVDAARETDRLVRAEGLWRLTGPLVTSSRLQELIRGRFAHIGTSTRATLEILAIGEPLDRQTLGLVADSDAIEDAEREGMVQYDKAETGVLVRLAHPLYGEVLAAGMLFTRRDEVTRQLADALEKTGAGTDEDLLRYVLWRLDMRQALPPDLLLQAARRALEARSLFLAERLARAGVDAGGGASAVSLLAIVHYRQARGEEALADLAGIHPVDESLLTEVTVLRASVLLWILGRPGEATRVITDAEARVTDRDCRAWLLATRASISAFAGRPEDSIALAAPLLELADLSPRPLLAALSAVGRGLALSGRADEAIRVAERGLDPELRTTEEVDEAVTRTGATILLAHLCSGRLDEAELVARLLYDTAMRLRSPEAQGPGATALGLIELLRGRVATAASLFREAELGLRTADVLGVHMMCLGGLAQALALGGEDEAAAGVLSEAERAGRAGINWFDWAVEVGRAWLLARGDRAEGANVAISAAETAEAGGQLPFASWAYHEALRIGASRLAAERLREVARRCDGAFPAAMALRASAHIADDPDGLLRASEAFEDLGMMLLAAEAAAGAALLKAGQGRRVEFATERARRLTAECEGAWSPVLEDLSGSPAGLSPREIAVARLALEGRSSPEIAGLLAISVRTVESHLSSIYRKLGIAGRADLPEALGGNPGD